MVLAAPPYTIVNNPKTRSHVMSSLAEPSFEGREAPDADRTLRSRTAEPEPLSVDCAMSP
jgi:hypothetical protein